MLTVMWISLITLLCTAGQPYMELFFHIFCVTSKMWCKCNYRWQVDVELMCIRAEIVPNICTSAAVTVVLVAGWKEWVERAGEITVEE